MTEWAAAAARFRCGLALRLAAGIAAVSMLGGCLLVTDPDLAREIAFPPEVPGLPAGQPWFSLPVGRWVHESGIAPVAISACSDPDCAPRGVIGLFKAAGAEAARLERVAARPEALLAKLRAEPRVATARKARPDETPSRPSLARAERTQASPLRIGRFSGFVLSLDGRGEAGGAALTARRGAETLIILVVAPDRAAAEKLARDVAAASG